jgi:intron-binding protein aquarius
LLSVLDGKNESISIDFGDTFVDEQHIIDSFPDATVDLKSEAASDTDKSSQERPFHRLNFMTTSENEQVRITSYRPERSSFGFGQGNNLRFTPNQVSAIRSGCGSGLTLVVGPPGTGKTDVAAQIVCNLYRAHPEQKILLVAHSNAALNDLFEKISLRNVDPGHMLRLGSGERILRTGRDAEGRRTRGEEFGRDGRIDWNLAQRQKLLEQVKTLATSLGQGGITAMDYTCQSAAYFYDATVRPKIAAFQDSCKQNGVLVAAKFPFTRFCAELKGSKSSPLFTGDASADQRTADDCLQFIEHVFATLADLRGFEILRTPSSRSDYLLTIQVPDGLLCFV